MNQKEFLAALGETKNKFTWGVGIIQIWGDGIRGLRKRKTKKGKFGLCPIEAVGVARRLRASDYEAMSNKLGIAERLRYQITDAADGRQGRAASCLRFRRQMLKVLGIKEG